MMCDVVRMFTERGYQEGYQEGLKEAAISHAKFYIEHGISKEEVIGQIALELQYSYEEAIKFLEREISEEIFK